MGGITARSMLWAKRLLVVGALCLGLAFALNGCSQAPSQNAPESADGAAQTDQAAQNETRTFTDSAGRTVEVPAKIDRIAPAGHTATQVLLTMAPDKLVTISTELTADQAKYLGGDYANLPVTGAAFGAKGDLNKEAVAASGAQILIDTGEIKDGIKEDLDTMQQQLGIPVVVIETKMEDYGAAYEKLGELLGMEDRGKELSDYCKAAYDETVSVMSKIPEGDRAKVAYLLGDMVPEGGYGMIPKYVFDGCLVAGESAGLCMNMGYQVRGMDFAVASGQMAGQAAMRALDAGDTSAAGLASYKDMMEGSFVIQDLRTFSKWPHVMEGWDRMFAEYPVMARDIFNAMFSVDGKPQKPLMKRMMPIVKQRGLFKLAGEVRKAVKSL